MSKAYKVSISIQDDLLAAISRRAKRLYGGNVSAVIAEMDEDIKRLEAMDRYLDEVDAKPLTQAARVRIDAELGLTV